jgi:N-acyl-D-aspartate/D-glutamate deacylase
VFDVVIANGRVVDGTGAPARSADVGIRDGRIAEIGDVGAGARHTVDAAGAVVAPGFVDLHSHYDAQVFWDPTLSPSSLHGVTSVIAGNCGLTLAPAAPPDRDFLVRLLARVEAIPIDALQAGVEFTWETFAEFLDAVAARPLGPNLGFMVGHSALRRAVMGDAASARAATPEEVAAMCARLDGALAAGGMGLSTATVATQVDGDGRPTPPNFATADELVALAEVCSRHAGTSLEFIPGSFLVGFSDEDVDLMARMSAAADRPLNWNTPLLNRAAPDVWRRQLTAGDRAAEQGGRVVPLYMPQNGPMQQDFLNGYVLRALPGWGWLFDLGPAERVRALREPATRTRLRDALDRETQGLAVTMRDAWGRHRVNDVHRADLAPLEGRRIDEIAHERGVTPFDAVLDIAADADLEVGFVRDTHDPDDEWWNATRVEVLRDPRVVLGASDSGAHGDMLVGADYPTRCLADLVRDKGIFTVEELVHRFTDVPARLYGLVDRGRLEPGAWADLVVFDPATVAAGPLRTATDLPGGATRLVTEAIGVHHVVVAGEVIVSGGRPTGATPGRVLRSGLDTRTVHAREPAGSGSAR